MNITNPTSFGSPNLTLSTSNSSGSSGALRSDDQILVYDTTVPSVLALASATGSAATSARRDHVHGGSSVCQAVFYNAATLTDKTGDSNEYTIPFTTEVINIGDDFDGDTTFTAPADGRYRITARCCLGGMTAANDFTLLTIVTANKNHRTMWEATNNMPAPSAAWEVNALLDLDEGDEVTVKVDNRGESSNIVDVIGTSTLDTALYVELLV